MRRQITHTGSTRLRYMIREIVQAASQIEACGQPISWENIGDPVRKGEAPPVWIQEIISNLTRNNLSYAYSDTQGDPATREFLAARANARLHEYCTGPGPIACSPITADDILFFNGIGDAVSKVFSRLSPFARVIGPSPAYSTHSSAEAAHAGSEHLTYRLDPDNGWLPDLDELEKTIHYNPSIAGILIINPDNPTGVVYSRAILEGFAAIAKRYNLFLICDETYAQVVYGTTPTAYLNQVIGDVPGISMRSISKEYPWPGGRCGWIEVYNRGADADFAAYIESIIAAKRLEVCATTLPQLSIPKVLGDPRYAMHIAARNEGYRQRAHEAWTILGSMPQLRVSRPEGGFFISPVFSPGALPADGSLPIENDQVGEIVEKLAAGAAADARFVYYLLGATGICVVPLSGFCSDLAGFRMTLLESDGITRRETFLKIREAIVQYCASAHTCVSA